MDSVGLGEVLVFLLVCGLSLWGVWASRRHARWQFAERERRFELHKRMVNLRWDEIIKTQTREETT